MPVLSIDYSRGSSTALLVNDDFSYRIAKFPMLTPRINFFGKFSNTEIFINLLSDIEERFKTQIYKKIPIYVSQFENNSINLEFVKFNLKSEAFKALNISDFVYFGHLNVGSKEGIYDRKLNFKEVAEELFFDEDAQTMANYFEDMNLYPFIQANSERDYYEEDTCLKFIVKNHCGFLKNSLSEDIKTVLFSTVRSLENEARLARFMLLCIESLGNNGFYDLKMDFRNFIGASAALAVFDNSIFEKVKIPSYFELGTLININDDIYCEFFVNGVKTQELDLKKNEIFSLPLHFSESVEVQITSGKFGKLKKTLNGGAFGIVLDTREKLKNVKTLSIDKRKLLMKKWEEELLERLKGF